MLKDVKLLIRDFKLRTEMFMPRFRDPTVVPIQSVFYFLYDIRQNHILL